MKISKNGQYLITGALNGEILMWNISMPSNFTLHSTLTEHSKPIQDLQLSFNSKHLYSLSADKTIRIWDIGCFSPKYVNYLNASAWGGMYLSNNGYIFINHKKMYYPQTYRNGRVYSEGLRKFTSYFSIWDIRDPENPMHVMDSEWLGDVTSNVISSDSKYLFIGLDHGAIRTYNIENIINTKKMMPITAFGEFFGTNISSLRLSENGKFLFAYAKSGKVGAWSIQDLPKEAPKCIFDAGCPPWMCFDNFKVNKYNQLFYFTKDALKMADLSILNTISDISPEHSVILELAVQAKVANTKADFTTAENRYLLDCYQSMPKKLQDLIAPYCILTRSVLEKIDKTVANIAKEK